jgi:uncharacterized protein involved in type VI secretion and phage assembly
MFQLDVKIPTMQQYERQGETFQVRGTLVRLRAGYQLTLEQFPVVVTIELPPCRPE